MSYDVNSVINNLSDRVGDVVEVITPVVESVNSISRTVVVETANSGMIHTVFGLCFFILALVLVFSLVWAAKNIQNKDSRIMAVIWLIVGIAISMVIGLSVILQNLEDWMAPTRQVIREVIENL